MTMNPKKPLLDVLSGNNPQRRPVWMMRQAGRYLPEYKKTRAQAGSFLELCYQPELAEEVTLQPLRRFDFDAAILFADILLIPDALGQNVSFREGEGPVLEPVRDEASALKLSTRNIVSHLAPVFETVGRLSQSLPSHVALIGFCGAPWTVATYMIEGGTSRDRQTARVTAWAGLETDSHWFNGLMELLIESSITYLKAQIAAGAEVLQIFETWASDLPPVLFDRYCIEPTRKIIDGVHETYPEVPIIGFPRGAGLQIDKFSKRSGVSGLGIDSGMALSEARHLVGEEMVLQGNLDPLCLLTGGKILEAEVRAISKACDPSRHIFNLGHGIVPATPVSHVEKMLSVLRNADAERA